MKNRPLDSSTLARQAIICFLALGLAGCGIPPDSGHQLGVPFRQQVDFNYCGAATVLMWRLYDGLPEISQEDIFDWMANYSTYCGSNQVGITQAVNHFTLTFDAYWDHQNDSAHTSFLARQTTSIESGQPVIAVYNYDHAVVGNGGKWHQQGAVHVWDFVYYHDPGLPGGSNIRASATDWMVSSCPGFWGDCDQILSSSASAGWHLNQQAFGDNIAPAGGGVHPDGNWPPEA